MKFEKLFSWNRYLWRIILWISLAVVLVTLILSTAVYYNSQKVLLQKEYDSNVKLFDQMKINIEMMDTMASNLCKSLYMNDDIRVIMYAKKEDVVNESTRINRIISSSISANPYVHSVTIYNSSLNRFYNAGEALFFDDKQLLEIIDGKQVSKLRPVSRNIDKLVNEKAVPENVFSYFMYDSSENQKGVEGAITLNIRTDWFMENLRHINMVEKERGEYVFALNGKNEFIEVNQANNQLKDWLKNEYEQVRGKVSEYEDIGFFQGRYQGVNYFMTYSYISRMDTTIIKVQRLSDVYSSIKNLRTSVVAVTIILLGVFLLISTGISRRIYKPVGKLVQMISSDKNKIAGNSNVKDEISYLSDFYRNSVEKLELYLEEKYQSKDIMKNYWLTRLLTDSYTIDAHKAWEIIGSTENNTASEEDYIVCILFIDNYKKFLQDQSSKDRDLQRFAVINIAAEVIAGMYKNEGIDMKEDHIALIIKIPKTDESCYENLSELVKEAQNYILEYFRLSVSASISIKTADICEITTAYNKAMDNTTYRLKLGHSCIIKPDDIKESQAENKKSEIAELEASLTEKIKSGSREELEEILEQIFKMISALDYDHILISLINMASIINNAIDSSAVHSRRHIHFDFKTVCQSIMEKETLKEIHNIVIENLGQMLDKESTGADQSKNSYIVDAVKDFILKNYQDSSLSLTKISTIMNISTRRLSKIFKDEDQVSVSDYINDVRLDKAAQLLSTTSLNVSEVVARLGIDNETYFYGMFKKKYGVTPKEYAFRRIVKMIDE